MSPRLVIDRRAWASLDARLYRSHITSMVMRCLPIESDVNIEYELEQDHVTLADVNVNIPLPSGNISLVVHQWEGSYTHKGRTLVWNIPIINKQQKSGTLEFTVSPAIPNDFFPLSVTWTSETPLAMLAANRVVQAEDGSPVDFSKETSFHPDKYEIV